ncbi:MAG: FAD-dependent oxidoreductase, partial [Pseudomonadota bacterium]
AMARVTVFGAGIFGLSVAWAHAQRGAEVEVVDLSGPASGASGGIVGALAPHVPENWNDKKAFQFESLDRGEAFWSRIEEVSRRSTGYARLGRIQPLNEESEALAKARTRSAETFWEGRYTWRIEDAAPYSDRLPEGTAKVIFDNLTARIHPRRATLALAQALRELGVRIVDKPKQTPEFEVWATGAAGLAALSAELDQPMGNAVKGQAALLGCDLGASPQIFVNGLHIIPHDDGTVAVGSTSERDFEDATGTDAQLDEVITRARALCPALRDAPVLERWAALRPRAKSRAPMLGPHPHRSHVFIANGGFKIGFGMAPQVGEVMADLILEGRDRIPGSFRVDANLRKATEA